MQVPYRTRSQGHTTFGVEPCIRNCRIVTNSHRSWMSKGCPIEATCVQRKAASVLWLTYLESWTQKQRYVRTHTSCHGWVNLARKTAIPVTNAHGSTFQERHPFPFPSKRSILAAQDQLPEERPPAFVYAFDATRVRARMSWQSDPRSTPDVSFGVSTQPGRLFARSANNQDSRERTAEPVDTHGHQGIWQGNLFPLAR